MDDHTSRPGAAVSQRIVVMTGVPAAGKSTLGRRLATGLRLPMLSLDAIKESLHDTFGERAGGPARLRFAAEAILGTLLHDCPTGAVLDVWLDPARADRDRLRALLPADAARCEVFCHVPAEVAVRRYADRVRHPMHRGGEHVLRRIEESVHTLDARGHSASDGLGTIIRVDATVAPDLPALLAGIEDALGRSGSEA